MTCWKFNEQSKCDAISSQLMEMVKTPKLVRVEWRGDGSKQVKGIEEGEFAKVKELLRVTD